MKILTLCALLPFLVPASATAGEGCDMKTVVKAAYCPKDKVIVEQKNLVSDLAYYNCSSCKTVKAAAGKCEKCGAELEKKTTDKNACKTCYTKTEQVDACEKTSWACDTCKKPMAKEGNCEKCQTPLKKQVSQALIAYKCPDCGGKSATAGTCPAKSADQCKSFGKPLVKECSKSGTPPHVPAAG